MMKNFHIHAFRFSSWRKEPANPWFVLLGLLMGIRKRELVESKESSLKKNTDI